MASKPRKIPTFTPEEMEQVEAGKRAVLDAYKGNDIPVKEIEPPTPEAPVSGKTSSVGGSWWNRGGVVKGYAAGGIAQPPFAEGGPPLPRIGTRHAKNAAKR